MPPLSSSPLARAAAVALLSLALAPVVAGAATPGGGAGAPAPSIIGGHAPTAGTWPSLVALLKHGTADTWQAQFCGGTLIAPQWVLTAAHCTVGESAAAIDVLGGTHTLGDGSGTRVTVTQIHEHPAYDDGTNANDISLLKLSTPLAQPTMAIAGPGLEPYWSAGRSAHAAGWGNISTTTDSYPRALREVDIPLVSDSACGSVWGPGFNPGVMVCAAGSGVDTCQGDSGGPLTVSDAAGRMVLIGDTSFGADCADPVYPGVYAETYAFRAWIDATVGWSRALAADRSSVAFTRPTTGSSSTSVTVTLSATGSAPIALASGRLSGTGADQFELLNDTCSATGMTAGSSCTVAVRAAPTVDADAAAWLTINSDIPGGVTSIPLTSGANPPDPGEPDPPTTDPGGGDPGSGGTTDPGGGGATDPGDSASPDDASDPSDVGDDSAPGVLRPAAGATGPAASAPAPAPAPAAAAKRAPKATIATASRKGATRRLSLHLAAAGTVKVTIQTRTRRPVTVATATARFTKAGTKVVALKLTPKARALLRTAGRIPATATAKVTAPGASATTSSLRLTLR